MKKILLLILFMITLTLSGCGEYEYTSYTANPDIVANTDLEITMNEAIELYGGGYSYVYDADYDTYLMFAYYDDEVSVCIDSNIDQRYIDASILAVEEYDALDFISISYHMSDDPSTTIIEPCTDDDTIIMITTYSGAEESFCSEEEGGDIDTCGCNYYWYNNEEGIFDSVIKFNRDVMDDMSDAELESIALHELTHLFGLDDLYEDVLENYSVMFWSSGDIIITDLTEFDLYNLEWMYGVPKE